MKKLTFALIAGCAFMQAAIAGAHCCHHSYPDIVAESPLNNSISTNKAILDSELLQEVVGQNEFIYDIQRLTRRTELRCSFEPVYYELVTKSQEGKRDWHRGLRWESEVDGVFESDGNAFEARHSSSSSSSSSSCDKHRSRWVFKKYLVKLIVSENGIGPWNVEVVSIKHLRKQAWEDSSSS